MDACAECVDALRCVWVGEVPSPGPDPPLEHLGVGAVLQHLGAVIALENKCIRPGKILHHAWCHHPGIGAAPDGYVSLPDGESARFTGIVRDFERLDSKVTDGKPLAIIDPDSPYRVAPDRPRIKEIEERSPG